MAINKTITILRTQLQSGVGQSNSCNVGIFIRKNYFEVLFYLFLILKFPEFLGGNI
jgi:hypothetical protein